MHCMGSIEVDEVDKVDMLDMLDLLDTLDMLDMSFACIGRGRSAG